MNTADLEAIIGKVLAKLGPLDAPKCMEDSELVRGRIPVEMSARHVHLDAPAMELLFGRGSSLTLKRALSQPGEFLAEQRVKLVTAKGELKNVAVLGPLRSAVQVELSATDCRRLGLNAPLRLSGDLTDAADVCILGGCGSMDARGSAIIPRAHVHLRPQDAGMYGIEDGQQVRVAVESVRPITFEGVIVRVSDNYAPAFHIDADEANACLLDASSRAFLLGTSGAAAPMPVQAEQRPAPCCADRLITEALARRLAADCREQVIHIQPGTILTPSARDVFLAARLQIVHD